ncbi:MAG: hypothetical protein J6A88_00260 [Oscillospiraceae bacterium]|nr:hypothetical protein [Oscillospiraceae bacterium]
MANYELIIEQRQPTCGGRAPTKSEIRMVTADDPVAYVQSLEPGCELEVTHNDDGSIVIKLDHNGLWVKYEFTED